MRGIRDLVDKLLFQKADYEVVFTGAAGQRVLADILRECGTHGNPHVPGDGDATLINVGRQQVGHYIISALHMSEAEIQRRAEERPYAIESED